MLRYKEEQESRYMCDTLGIKSDTNHSTYPNDLENLIHYLRINAKAQGSSNAQSIKGSSFTTGKKIQQVNTESGQKQRRVIVISGFLLCLKIFNSRRFEFIKDFNEALKSVFFSPLQTPLIIFTLSDSQDRLSSFHAKLFSREILS